MTAGKHTRKAPASRRLVVAAVAVPILLAGGTAAYAYWSATGSGTAAVKANTAVVLAVNALTTPVADLYPGKTDDLGFTVANANSYPVNLTKLTAISVTSSDQTNCPAATYVTLASAVTTGVAAGGYTLPSPISVPAGATAAAGSMTGLITLATSAPDACQGKTFSVSLTFAGSQV